MSWPPCGDIRRLVVTTHTRQARSTTAPGSGQANRDLHVLPLVTTAGTVQEQNAGSNANTQIKLLFCRAEPYPRFRKWFYQPLQ